MASIRRGSGTRARLRLARFGEPMAPSTALAGKRVTWLAGTGTRPQFVAGAIGPLPIFEAVVPPVWIGHCPVQRAAGRPGRQLVLHLAGHGHYRTAGVTVEQRPGDVVVLAAEALVEVTHPAGAHVVVLALPAAAGGPPPSAVQRLGEAPGRVVAHSVLGLVEEAEDLGAGMRAGLAQHVAGLVDLALADATLEAGDPTALRQQEVLSWLEAHLAEPELTAETAAASLGLSRRWLHALLQGAGTSFKTYLTERRLETCRARLADPALASQPITAIVLASGFNDLSTFYRQFRRRYRTTPKALRPVPRSIAAGRGR